MPLSVTVERLVVTGHYYRALAVTWMVKVLLANQDSNLRCRIWLFTATRRRESSNPEAAMAMRYGGHESSKPKSNRLVLVVLAVWLFNRARRVRHLKSGCLSTYSMACSTLL